jgi:hypothetical protein
MLDAYEAVVNSRLDSCWVGPGIGGFPTSRAPLFALQTIRQLFISFPRIRQADDSALLAAFTLQGLRQSGRVNPALIYLLFLRS